MLTYQRNKMEKWTVKNIKIDRIKSEDIVADIKDTILHCQLFKVQAPLFFDSIYISIICNLKCTKLLKIIFISQQRSLNKCEINTIIKNILV